MTEIHIFNGFMNPYGGSEKEALFLYSLLKKNCRVSLWATSSRASKELLLTHPIQRILILKNAFPKGGTYIFLGAHWRNKYWSSLITKPDRLIYVFNTFHPRIARLVSKHPFWLKWPNAEIVLISDFQSQMLGLNGVIHPSPIDISGFTPKAYDNNKRFTLGRMSRDTAGKHHLEDVSLYIKWLNFGFKILIQGGSVLKDHIPDNENFVVTPEGSIPAQEFFHQLDVFYYRSGEHVETFGRVVFEAMACGIPVVCHYYGGYAEHLQHGKNGFLFKTEAEAMEIMLKLYSDFTLRKTIGMAGRKTAEELFSISALESRAAYYQ
jgi:glycosyltransferase involved in cell wall biosynthesis